MVVKTANAAVIAYRDYSYILPRKHISAVVISTTARQHAIQTVHAAKEGLHV